MTVTDKTRSSIMAVFNSMADGLLDGLIYELFSTKTTVTPDACESGKIIILNVPAMTYGDTGRMV